MVGRKEHPLTSRLSGVFDIIKLGVGINMDDCEEAGFFPISKQQLTAY